MSFVRSKLSLAIIATLTTSAFANENQTQTNNYDPLVSLNTIVVEADKNNEVGKTTYTKEDLEKIPNSSKNITDLFKVNPNVQFNVNARSGLQQGELTPSEISINGGLGYENKYLINGLSINNNINPASEYSSNNLDQLMGSSQTVAVNTDLLCDVTLLDSNVSAEYGEFTGGVVSANTCAPKTEIGKIHGSLSYDYTSDNWRKIHFPTAEDQEDFEESVSEDNQPKFTKQGISSNIYGNLTETLGFNAFGSYRWSDIPLKTSVAEPTHFDQKRESTNAGVEIFYTPNENTALKIGTQFMENVGDYFHAVARNSESTHSSNSQNFYINLKNKLDTVELQQQLNYQIQQADRVSANYNYNWLKSSTKNWKTTNLQNEGHFGSLAQEEEKLEYSIKALFTPLKSGNFTHNFKMGAGFGHYNADWSRPEITNVYSAATGEIANLNCYSSNINRYDACDEGNGTDGQYFKNRTSYTAGVIDIQQDRWHAYLEDQIQWNNSITATLGFRTDYDTLTKNNNVAPRSSLVFKPFGNNQLYFTTGWNRYYGLNSFYNELQDRQDSLIIRESRQNVTSDWKAGNSTGTITYRSQLDTPYSDETLFAINAEYANTKLGLKWVNRDNKDQLRRTQSIKNPEIDSNRFSYTYDNEGKSQSDIYTFSISNIQPLEFMGTQNHLSFSADYTETNRNFTSYSSTYYIGTPEIYYDGEIINAEDRPAETFNTPWTTRLSWDIKFDHIPLTISNFASYQGKVDAMKKVSKGYTDAEGTQYDMYTPYTTNNKFYWDMRTTYDLALSNNNKAILGLTINNVTDKKNNYFVSGIAKPEIGRQFIADVTFKF